MCHRLVIAISFLMVLYSGMVQAQTKVPRYVNFQSVLRDDSGNLIEDGFIDLTVKILDQDKDEVYAEIQPGVQVIRSAISVMVGEGIVPGSRPSVPTGGIPFDALDPAGGSRFLQIQFGSNQPGDPLELGSVPYAIYAQTALGLAPNILASDIPSAFATDEELEQEREDRIAGDANDLTTSTVFGGDISGTYNNLQINSGSITVGDLNGASFSNWDQDTSDDITTATNFGGDVSGTYNNLQLAPNSVGSSEIANQAVGATEINDSSTRTTGLTPFAVGSIRPIPFTSLLQVSSAYNVGVVTRVGSEMNIFFSSAAPSDQYVVVALLHEDGINLRVSSKTTTGFTITSSISGDFGCDVVVFGVF